MNQTDKRGTMNYEEIRSGLKACAELLHREKIAEVDFQQLADQLVAASELFEHARRDRKLCIEMIAQFRADLRRRARASARLSGGDSTLIEKLIDSEELTFEELLNLRRQIESEFDQAFASTLTEPPPAARCDEKLAAFKS